MHRPFVTTVKFENENGIVMRLECAVAAADTADAKTELERRLKNRRSHHTSGADAQATSKLRDAAGLNRISRGNDVLSSARRDLPNQ
jgi:hypothetical protein